MKAVVAAFNQEKALVGAFSVITNLRMELFQALVSMPKLRKPIVVVSCTSLKLLKIRALHKLDEIGGARPGCEEPGAARDRYVTPSRVLARRRPHVRRPAGCGDEDRIEVVLNWGEQLQTLDTHQTLSRIFL